MESIAIVPIERWGHDHWSTLAYVETRCVDHKGILLNTNLRCNARLHRTLANIDPWGEVRQGERYPTRLANGETIEPHDDWSCVEDMAAAGLLTYRTRRHKKAYLVRYEQFGMLEALVTLSPLGEAVAAALRAHKANGGSFSAFTWPIVTGQSRAASSASGAVGAGRE